MTASRLPGAALLPILFLLACRPGTAERPAASEAPAMSASEAPPPKSSKPLVLSTSDREITLDKERTTVAVKVPVALPESVGSEGGRLGLYLDGVEGRSGAFFEVYANLPAGSKPNPSSPSYVGNLAIFGQLADGTSAHAGHGGDKALKEDARLAYDVTRLIERLQGQAGFKGDLKLDFVPKGLEPAPGQASPEALPKTHEVRFARVKLVRE